MTGPIRVLSSFVEPRATTNPYITMLDAALTAEPTIAARRFSWKTALLGRYDVFHWHWPESRMQGSSWWKSAVLLTLTALLAARLRWSRHIAVVQTAHNLELPKVGILRTRLLAQIRASADLRIVLTPATPALGAIAQVLIPHGHYRDWFAPYPHRTPISGHLASFGQVRQYKGLDGLLTAYAAVSAHDPSISLHIGGKPTSEALADELRAQTASLPRLTLELRFLSDAELVGLATEAELVVLAYRFMHNSGSALAALSLDRPVLVPDTAANARLAAEVGEGWVLRYQGELQPSDLVRALTEVRNGRTDSRPNLDARSWDRVGAAHAACYRQAITIRSQRPGNGSRSER